MTNATNMSLSEVIELYSLRWQIELFFKELKSTLVFLQYRFQKLDAVEAWVNTAITTVLFLETVAQWVWDRTAPTELLRVTDGPRKGVIGLVAASLDRELLPVVEEHHSDGIQTECHSSRCSATCCSRAFESTE